MLPAPVLDGALAVDARMLRHSGIGIVLQRLLDRWRVAPPAQKLLLLGDPDQLADYASPSCRIIRWTPPVYSFAAAFSPPRLPVRPRAWYSPHYATCLRPGSPLVCHIQDVLHIDHPTRRGTAVYMLAYLAALRRSVSYVLTSTRHVKVQLQTLYGFPAEQVLISGLGPGFLESEGSQGTLPKGLTAGGYLLAVGIFKVHKNWPFLLERLVELGDRVPPLAAAGLGRDGAALAELANRLGYHRLTVLPNLPREQMAMVFRQAAALVHSSIAEGFGLPLLEALQAGTPVVCAGRSPMKEIVGRAGFLFDPDWAESFDQALLQALTDGPERALRLEEGRRQARHWNWERTADVVQEALYRAATGKLPPAQEP
jgi:glycosyltransferase involved in cell wall biosynthesis